MTMWRSDIGEPPGTGFADDGADFGAFFIVAFLDELWPTEEYITGAFVLRQWDVVNVTASPPARQTIAEIDCAGDLCLWRDRPYVCRMTTEHSSFSLIAAGTDVKYFRQSNR